MLEVFHYILILILIVIPTYFGYKKCPKEMFLSILSISLALSFLNINKITRFKGGGIEVEMREVVDKAYAAIEELKNLSLALSDPIISTTITSDRSFQYIHLKYKIEQIIKIEETLKKLGATDKEIHNTTSLFWGEINSEHLKRLFY